jgi:hypothetical protein
MIAAILSCSCTLAPFHPKIICAHQRGEMSVRIGFLALAFLLCAGVARAETTGAPPAKTIRVYKAGSSSFGPELMLNAIEIAKVSCNARIEHEPKKDSSSYTRMDAFVREPGFYEAWCAQYLPEIAKGHYDVVIFQTISWVTMTPEEQDKLLSEILPDLVARIRKIGPEVALYDKYVRGSLQEKDPHARLWDGRYPDAQRLNCLLLILAAKKAGITKITFSGEAIVAGWEIEPFKDMKYLYNDIGHPGVIAHYMNGFCAAAMLTGVDPIGCPVRRLPIPGWIPKQFNDEPAKGGQAFYNTWKSRIDGDAFIMSNDEAKLAQELALKHRRYWDGRLQAALKAPAEFAKVEAEIAELRAGFDKPELAGMSQKGIEAYRKEFQAGVSADGISEPKIQKMRDKSGKMADFSKLVSRHLKAPDDKATHQACIKFWTETNGKFRDDVLFEAMLHEERVTAAGNREEVARMKQVVLAVNGILNMGGYRMIYERLPETEKAAFLAKQDGPRKRFAPSLTAALKASADDPERYFKICDAYLKVWKDVNLMDKLKAEKFATQVFLEADKEFAQSNP